MGDIKMIFEYDENNLEKYKNFKGGEKYIEAKMYFMMDKEKNFIKEVFIIVLKVINIQWLMIMKKILFILQLYLNNNSCLSRIIVFFKV